jgi:uracil-DNA glycosylase
MIDSLSDFNEGIEEVSLSSSPILVPNQHPTIPPTSYRLAIIGEAPGADEEAQGKPFVGQSGRFLDAILSKIGISRACCFVGNVCQTRPPGNDISKFEFEGKEISAGLSILHSDLQRNSPFLCVLLGKTALYAAKRTKALADWRGSTFISDVEGPFLGRKCLATYHPAACLRQYEWTPLLTFDLRKALIEARTPNLTVPPRDIYTNLSFAELCNELDHIIQNRIRVSPDIEGGIKTMSCIGLATSPGRSIVVPFAHLDGSSYWSIEEEIEIWKRVATIMADQGIKKTWQNGLYDRFVQQFSYHLITRGNEDDTMLKWWELYCELEKRLSLQTSILTNEPFYKFERKAQDQETFYRYCGKDSCVTYEINEKLGSCLDSSQLSHYQFNNSLLNVLLYAELRGIRYNEDLARSRLNEVNTQIYEEQEKLDTEARNLGALDGINFEASNSEILSQVRQICCYKKDQTTPKKVYEEAGYYGVISILDNKSPLTPRDRGLVSSLCGLTMNTKSSRFKTFLYGTCGLPTQWKQDPSTKEMRITTDYEALLKLSKSHNHPVLGYALSLSRLRTRGQMLAIRPSNGRMHCSYNLVGSETGRVTSSKSILVGQGGKRVGANLQTIPDDWDIEDQDSPLAQGMRDLFLADPECYLGKCDLKGADGWTVGAYMAMLGDPTMLDDLKFDLKPAKIVAYILKHGASKIQFHSNDREALKNLCDEIQKEDWEYFVSKQGIWGTCYTMGPRKLAERVFIESEGKVNLSEREAREFQSAIYVRYRVKLWHDWMQRYLTTQPYPAKLVTPNGQIRRFFGRNSKQRCEILGEALAHIPQVVTTYATLTAAKRLWSDPDNRTTDPELSPLGKKPTSGCLLRIEPLHQVHDELVVQFKIQDTAWAIGKLKSWFANEIVVANQRIIIPFDGAYGTAWSMDETHKVGAIK